MSYRYYYNTMNKNPSTFRFWGDKPRQVIEVLYHDTALGFKIIEGFVRDALAPDFEVINSEGEVVEVSEANKNLAKEIYIKARSAQRAYGYSVLAWFSFDGGEETLYWIEDKDITEMQLKPATRDIEKFIFNPNHREPNFTSQPIEVKNKAMSEDLLLLGEFDTTIGMFRSFIEPIFDNIVSYSILQEQFALLVIRIGSGIRVIKAPVSHLQDATMRRKYEQFLENFGMNSLLLVPDGITDQFEFELNFGDGAPPFNQSEATDAMLVPITIYTNLTVEYLKGGELGLRSSETNRSRTLNEFEKEQRYSDRGMLFNLSKLEDNEALIDGTHKIRYMPLLEMDEKEKIAIEIEKLMAIQDIDPSIIEAIDPEDLLDHIGLDINFDRSKYEKAKTEREALKQKLQEGMSEGNEDEELSGNGDESEDTLESGDNLPKET